MREPKQLRREWRQRRKTDKREARAYWNTPCDRCGYKRKHHAEFHSWGIVDGPLPWSRIVKACGRFLPPCLTMDDVR